MFLFCNIVIAVRYAGIGPQKVSFAVGRNRFDWLGCYIEARFNNYKWGKEIECKKLNDEQAKQLFFELWKGNFDENDQAETNNQYEKIYERSGIGATSWRLAKLSADNAERQQWIAKAREAWQNLPNEYKNWPVLFRGKDPNLEI